MLPYDKIKFISDADLSAKLIRLKESLVAMDKIAVAYSGGVDSTFLLKIAYDLLRNKAIGIYVDSPLQPQREKQEAIEVAQLIQAEIYIINLNPLSKPDFKRNPDNRCYFCKGYIFDEILKTATAKGYQNVVDGSNHDDTGDYRPGKKALMERKIGSPLQEVGLTKEEIRFLSKEYDLPTWNKDAYACLASRIPYDVEITSERLNQIDKAEQLLRSKGYRDVRARYYGDEVRIEVRQDQVKKLQQEVKHKDMLKAIIRTGFTRVYIEPLGYQQGNLNKWDKK